MLDILVQTSIVGLVRSYMQRESEAPLVAIRDMANKLQARTIPKGVREEVKLGAERHSEWTLWAAQLLQFKHDGLTC